MSSILPSLPVKIGFDIANEALTKEAWAHPTTRTLCILWAPRHLIGEHFWQAALRIGKTIEKRQPKTIGELVACFGRDLSPVSNFPDGDVKRFCDEALPFFTGEREATFELTAPNKHLDGNTRIT